MTDPAQGRLSLAWDHRISAQQPTGSVSESVPSHRAAGSHPGLTLLVAGHPPSGFAGVGWAIPTIREPEVSLRTL